MSRYIEQDPRFRSLYLNNPAFRQMADAMIPVVLEGIAAKAEEWDELVQQGIRERMEAADFAFDPEELP